MSKTDIFGKNKNHLVKKVAIYIIIALLAEAFIPIGSSCHNSWESWRYERSECSEEPEEPGASAEPEEMEESEKLEESGESEEIEEPKKKKPKPKRPRRRYIPNLFPVANANGPYHGIIDKEIEFNGSKSYDPDGIITNYSWSFGDGTTKFGEVVTHKYSRGGSFVVELTILDNSGASDNNKITAVISVPNNPPSIPMISGPNGSKDTKYSYAFGSTDPDNDDISYIINWGDNTSNISGFLPSGHFISILHSWAESGEYSITVTASDSQSSTSAEITIHIEDNVIADNIAIIILGIIALIALMIALIYSKKDKKKK